MIKLEFAINKKPEKKQKLLFHPRTRNNLLQYYRLKTIMIGLMAS